MKALEILKKYQDEIQTAIPSEVDIDEAIYELEELQSNYEAQEIILADLKKQLEDLNGIKEDYYFAGYQDSKLRKSPRYFRKDNS